jgi:hypothetical protein
LCRGAWNNYQVIGGQPVGLLFSLSYWPSTRKIKNPPSENQVCPDDLRTQPDWLEQQAWFLATLDAKFSQQADLIKDLLDTSLAGGGGSFCQGSHLAMHLA